MSSFLAIFNMVISIAWWIIIVQAVMSWLISFNVLNIRQPLVHQIWSGINRVTEPVYRPIRRIMPSMGGLDLTPVIVLLALSALQIVVNNNFSPY
ncbi:MAG: YggT family protein [Paracoccaceae bacterium]